MFHDAINQYCWDKLYEEPTRNSEVELDKGQKPLPKPSADLIEMKRNQQAELRENSRYTDVNNADLVPEIANEFMTDYIDDMNHNKGNVPILELVDLVQHCCHWMFH